MEVLTHDGDKRCNVRPVGTNLIFDAHKGYLFHETARSCLSWDLIGPLQKKCRTACEFFNVGHTLLHWGHKPEYEKLKKTFFGCLNMNEQELNRCRSQPVLFAFMNAKTGKLQFLCQDHYDMIVSYPGIESEKHLYTAFHKFKKTVAKYNDNIRVSHAFYEIGIFMGSPMFNNMGDDAKFVRESAIFNNGMNDWRVEDE